MNSTTTMGYLYRNIIIDELKCVEYLKSKNLISNNCLVCSKNNIDGTECGGRLHETTRSSKKTFGRYFKKNCYYEVYEKRMPNISVHSQQSGCSLVAILYSRLSNYIYILPLRGCHTLHVLS